MKDELENKLHLLVKTGKMDLRMAQLTISQNWVTGFSQYVRADYQNDQYWNK